MESSGPLPQLADVGSGGGYPGLVIAAVRPELEIVLIEPLQKRARLLTELATALDLRNVQVQAIRAEEAGRSALRDSCSVVAARAVANLSELLEYTAPLTADHGRIYLPKGSAFGDEFTGSTAAMNALKVSFVELIPMRESVSDTLSVALFEKAGTSDARYPRRPGIPAKRPL